MFESSRDRRSKYLNRSAFYCLCGFTITLVSFILFVLFPYYPTFPLGGGRFYAFIMMIIGLLMIVAGTKHFTKGWNTDFVQIFMAQKFIGPQVCLIPQ